MTNEEKILAMLEQMNQRFDSVEKRLDDMPTRDEMNAGFDRLENLINVAAKDAAQTEKLLREHLEQPHIA